MANCSSFVEATQDNRGASWTSPLLFMIGMIVMILLSAIIVSTVLSSFSDGGC
jgi:hypothetical protein